MRQTALFLLLLLLAAAGCKHPTDVVVDPPETGDRVEVVPIMVRDTSIYQNELDSIGVAPEDQARYAGFFLLSRVTFDAGAPAVTKAFTKLLVTDLDRPLVRDGRLIGHWGVDVRPAPLQLPLLNGIPMIPMPHWIRDRGVRVLWGLEFARELSLPIRSDTLFTWRVPTDTIGRSVAVSIQPPPALTVSMPAGGSVLRRDQDLRLRWSGAGSVTIYISALDPLTRHARPLLKLLPVGSRGQALVPAKVLRALPPRDRLFVFTFILANRKENTLAQAKGVALVQAASVYNSYVEFR